MTYQTLRNEIDALQKRLDEIAELARKYNHAGCNTDTHAAMNKVLDLATGEKREYR